MIVCLSGDFCEHLWDLSNEEFRAFVKDVCSGELPAQTGPGGWKRILEDGGAAERKRGRIYWPDIYERDGHACRHCAATEALEIDHLLPVSRGGRSVPENLAVLCGPCNRAKGARTWDEWMEALSCG